ncbi:hypothetical protein D3C72_2275920 [compost metagenome]
MLLAVAERDTCHRLEGARFRSGADRLQDQSTNSTVTPTLTILASSVASQLVRRTQPWLWVLPIFEGSGVP